MPLGSSELASDRLGRIVEDAASEAFVFSSQDYRFRLVNKGARKNLGYTIEELRVMTPWDLKPLISKSAFLDMVKPLLAGDAVSIEFDTVHRRKDGTDYEVAVTLQLFDDADDPVFYAAIRDISLHRQIESAWRSASSRLNAILSNTTMAVFLLDERQHCAFMNKAAEALTGYVFAETEGRPLHDVIHHTRPDGSHFPVSECAIDRAFPENAGMQGEEVFVHKDGSFYPVAFTASPIEDDRAKIVGTIVEVRDISEEKRNEEARHLLMREVDHRGRNILAIVGSILRLTRADDLESYKSIVTGRIGSMARAQTSLASRRWEGGRLDEVVMEELAALCPTDRFVVQGPEIALTPEQVQPISMLLHELATNANKYGSLSQGEGRVAVVWAIKEQQVTLSWQETGGPAVTPPSREGFGSTLKKNVVRQINGTIDRKWEPGGLVVEIAFPL